MKMDKENKLLSDINILNIDFLKVKTRELQDKQFELRDKHNYSREEAAKIVLRDLESFYKDINLEKYWYGILNFWDFISRMYGISGDDNLYLRSIHFKHYIILFTYWKKILENSIDLDNYEHYLCAIIEHDWSFDELEKNILKFGGNIKGFPDYQDVARKLKSGWVSKEIKNLTLNYHI